QADPMGRAELSFRVPSLPPGAYQLEVVSRSLLGEETLRRALTLRPLRRLLLVTDRPAYQPGQTICVRALALEARDLTPLPAAVAAPLTVEIEDARANKLCRRELTTSHFGIASTDFPLADEVNAGAFRVRAVLAGQRAERLVNVKPYVLPRFRVVWGTDRG